MTGKELTPQEKDKLFARLGRKAGPGRPKKSVKYADLYRVTQDEMHALLTLIPTSLKELVTGVYREHMLPDGKTVRVYRSEPNIQAIRIVLERTFGKAVQPVEVSGSLGLTDDRGLDLGGMSKADRLALLSLAAERIKHEEDPIDGEYEEVASEAPERPGDA